MPIAEVGIRRKRVGRAYYSGLVICSRVFTCPPCAYKIQETRRREIQEAIDWAYQNGLKCIMVTFTFPHTAKDELASLMKRFAEALSILRSGNGWDKRKKKMGFAGLIRSLEITFGANGPHAHTHELWLVSLGTDVLSLHVDILNRWRNACETAKLVDFTGKGGDRRESEFNVHAVDIRDAVSGSAYLAKLDQGKAWGIDAELAKASSKKGRKGGRTAFQILETIAQNAKKLESGQLDGAEWEEVSAAIKKDKRIFLEYAKAFKGKAQIFWSHGLKEKVGVDLLSDEKAAVESLSESDLLTMLPADAWLYVRARNLRAELLNVAETHGYNGVFAWFKAKEIDLVNPNERSITIDV